MTDDVTEVEEPTIKPYRAMLAFTGVSREGGNDIAEILESLNDEAERRGIFPEFGGVLPMPVDDVIEGSPLWSALTGQPIPYMRD